MPRDVDERKTRKALRKLRKVKARAEAEGIDLTDWEKEFFEGVDERLLKYGSAFADMSLGQAEEALSSAQAEILRQLDKKSRGKSGSGFKTRKPLQARKGFERAAPRVRQLDDDIEASEQEPDKVKKEGFKPRLIDQPQESSVEPSDPDVRSDGKKPALRVIRGGKSDA